MMTNVSLHEVFRRLGRVMFREALSDAPGGLLDELPYYPIADRTRETGERVNEAQGSLRPRDIDYRHTTDEMILDGEFVLRADAPSACKNKTGRLNNSGLRLL